MSKHDDTVYLRHMLDAIEQIESYLHGISRERFFENRMVQDAVVRQLEIIGEASRNLSEEFQAQHEEIPWGDIIGMRHKIAHNYLEVDLQTVWDTVRTDLPPLKDWLIRALGEG